MLPSPGRAISESDGDLATSGFTAFCSTFGIGSGIAIRKTDTALLQKFNAAIAAIRANGTYKKIQDKYFDFDIYGND